MTNSRTNQSNGSMSRAEAEEALGRAARIETDASDRLRVGELVDAGKEVGISEASVHQALLEQEKARFEQERARAARKAIVSTWMRRTGVAAIAAAMSMAIFEIVGVVERDRLASEFEHVEHRRSDVHSATERRNYTLAWWMDIPRTQENDANRTADLVGSENRVHIAIRRYDTAVAAYNRYAESMTLESTGGMPKHLPYSSEVRSW